ncbi:hypothetical protein EKO04_009927 [Ascochyta lentis]|uniref:Uncharacterized protein n=1 Tax=Ascochyta lentis TaxID=205686 RepID=A0A8H7MDK3_9PLEO|nr:hypothetical protein EKO04_009927 [Ascochyta lentis]
MAAHTTSASASASASAAPKRNSPAKPLRLRAPSRTSHRPATRPLPPPQLRRHVLLPPIALPQLLTTAQHALPAHRSRPPAPRLPPALHRHPALHPAPHRPDRPRARRARRPQPERRLHQPPRENRNNRDPYAGWWDQQDRRNYGEPCHEDHDILGAISLHDYNHFTPGWGAVLLGTFVATVLGLCVAVNQIYPDKVSAPKTYPDGLEAELGGKGAVLARKPGAEW